MFAISLYGNAQVSIVCHDVWRFGLFNSSAKGMGASKHRARAYFPDASGGRDGSAAVRDREWFPSGGLPTTRTIVMAGR